MLVSELACLGENRLLALMAILQLRRVALRSGLGAGMDHLRAHGPLGGVERPRRMVRCVRLMDSARSRSWRTCGPRRLRRQSQPVLVATHPWCGTTRRQAWWAGRRTRGWWCWSRSQLRCWAKVAPAALDASCGARSHSHAWVGCMVCSTTASTSAESVSRSSSSRSLALNAAIVRAAS